MWKIGSRVYEPARAGRLDLGILFAALLVFTGSAWAGNEENGGSRSSGIRGVVIDETGMPVKDGRITLVEALAPPILPGMHVFDILGALAEPEKVLAEGRTDINGRFEIRPERDPGELVCVRVEAKGYADGRVRWPGLEEARKGKDLTITLRKGRTLSGRVRNGGGEPIARARVAVLAAMGTELMRLYCDRFIATTADDGSFRLESLPEGRHLIHYRADGCASCLAEDVEVPGKDLLDLVLDPPFSVRGKVTDGVSGRPLSNVKVIARCMGGKGGFGIARTGREGKFSLPSLAPGSYKLIFAAEGYPERIETVLGEPKEAKSLGVVLVKAPLLEGRVLEDGWGKPLEGVWVVAGTEFGPLFSHQPFCAARGRSDGEGFFRITGIPVGYDRESDRPLVIFALKDGWCQPAQDRADLPRFRLSGLPAGGVEIRMRPAPVLKGRIVDEGGNPVAGARIETRTRGHWTEDIRKELKLGAVTAASDGAGNYSIPLAPGYEVQVVVTHDGYAPAFFEMKRLRFDKGTVSRDFTLSAGGTVEVQIRHETGEAVGPRLVEYTFLFEGEKPTCIVYPPCLADEKQVRTDGEGKIVLRHLIPGTWQFELNTGDPYRPGHRRIFVAEGAMVRIEFEICESVSIEGVVVDEEGNPVPGARAGSDDVAGGCSKSVGVREDGGFSIEGLHSGSYRVSAFAPGYEKAVVEKVSGGARGLRLVLKKKR